MTTDTPHPDLQAANLSGVSWTERAPKWAMQPFEDFVDYTERAFQLVHLSIQGISQLPHAPRLIEVLARGKGTLGEDKTTERLKRAKAEAELASREIAENFPILHAQATIALWGALENLIRVFTARWLENSPGALQAAPVQRLRVRIGDYESLDGEDRFFFIVDQLERELNAPLRSGVNRFEALLEVFRLSGAVDKSISDSLYQLSQVRNVLVHCGGRADRRLRDALPSLGLCLAIL